MLFNFGQLVVHGVLTNSKMKGVYNPGLFAVVFLHLPLSIYFIWYVCSTGMIAGWDWLWAFLYAAFAAGFCVGSMTYVVFASRKTTWAFSPAEMQRFHVKEKLARRGVVVDASSDEAARGPLALMGALQKRLHDRP